MTWIYCNQHTSFSGWLTTGWGTPRSIVKYHGMYTGKPCINGSSVNWWFINTFFYWPSCTHPTVDIPTLHFFVGFSQKWRMGPHAVRDSGICFFSHWNSGVPRVPYFRTNIGEDLVGGFSLPLWKKKSSSVGIIIPNIYIYIWKNKKMFQTTNQKSYLVPLHWLGWSSDFPSILIVPKRLGRKKTEKSSSNGGFWTLLNDFFCLCCVYICIQYIYIYIII